MAPKQAKAAAPEDPTLVEHQRLQDAAFDLGVLSRTRRLCTQPLPPTKVMQRAGGKDIVKRSSTRKGRYLLAFNFQLAPAAAGKLGTLAALDSKNPVMYLDFPQGRYKLFGTLVFPRNKYLVLRMGQKEVLCEDVLESMIVFSEGWWIGTAEENPEEGRLPDPDWLALPPLHQKFDFSGRGTAAATTGATGKDTEAADEEDEDEEEPASQRPQRRASRGVAGKRLRYNEDSGVEEEADEDSEAEERAPRKLQRTGSQQQRAQRTAQAKQQPESHPIDLVGNASSEDDDQPLAARAAKPAQGTLDAFVKKAAAAPKSAGKAAAAAAKPKPARKRTVASDSEDEEFVDLAGSSDEEAAAATQEPPSSVRPRSQRKAAGAASKKLRIREDSGSEDEDGGEAGRGDDDPTEEASGSEAASGSEDEEDEEASEDEASDYEPSE